MIHIEKKDGCMMQSSCPTKMLQLSNAETFSHISTKTEVENLLIIFAVCVDRDLQYTKK